MPLTPENAQRFSRLHPRCGTSFLLIVMIVAIFVFAPLGLPEWYLLVASRIIGVPLIAGLSFEVIKFAGRNRRKRWVQTLMWPGMQLQKLTTREPDHEQLAVAIAAHGGRARRRGPPRRVATRTRSAWRSWPSNVARGHRGFPVTGGRNTLDLQALWGAGNIFRGPYVCLAPRPRTAVRGSGS